MGMGYEGADCITGKSQWEVSLCVTWPISHIREFTVYFSAFSCFLACDKWKSKKVEKLFYWCNQKYEVPKQISSNTQITINSDITPSQTPSTTQPYGSLLSSELTNNLSCQMIEWHTLEGGKSTHLVPAVGGWNRHATLLMSGILCGGRHCLRVAAALWKWSEWVGRDVAVQVSVWLYWSYYHYPLLQLDPSFSSCCNSAPISLEFRKYTLVMSIYMFHVVFHPENDAEER